LYEKPKDNKTSLCFFMAANNLVYEQQAEPWAKRPTPDREDIEPYIEFMLEKVKEGEMAVLFDGGNSVVRAMLLLAVDKFKKRTVEAWAIYKGLTGMHLSKRIPYGNINRETFIILFPKGRCRSRMEIKERKVYCDAGESSTTDSTYSGIPRRHIFDLPLISIADKAKILACDVNSVALAPPAIAASLGVGVPLAWQDIRPVPFLRQLFRDLDVGFVVDVTPGSGSLGEAALEHGLGYNGLSAGLTHQVWLQTLFDKKALCLICEREHPLYQKELVVHVKEYFSELLAPRDHFDQADIEVDVAEEVDE
jgi:hypothetical protein